MHEVPEVPYVLSWIIDKQYVLHVLELHLAHKEYCRQYRQKSQAEPHDSLLERVFLF